jgi:hypothetical protein
MKETALFIVSAVRNWNILIALSNEILEKRHETKDTTKDARADHSGRAV